MALAFALLALPSACGPIAKSTAKGFNDAASEKAQDPKTDEATTRLIRSILQDPGVRESTRGLAAAGAEGVVDGMKEALLREHAEQVVDTTLATMKRHGDATLVRFVDRGGAALAVALRGVVAESLREVGKAVKSETKDDLPVITRAVVASTVEAMLAASNEAALPADPSSAPAAVGAAGPPQTPAVGRLARMLSREVVAGIQEGSRDAAPANGPVRGPLQEIGYGIGEGVPQGLFHARETAFLTLPVVLGGLLSVALAVIVVLWRLHAKTLDCLARQLPPEGARTRG